MTTSNSAPYRASARSLARRRAARRAIAVAVLTATAVSLLSLAAAGAAAAVPAHGRAWEKVTPPNPNGVAPVASLAIDATGDRVAYGTIGPLPGAAAGTIFSWQLAIRGATGWRSVPVSFPYPAAFENPIPFATSKDLSTWMWVSAAALLPGAPSFPDTGVYRGTTEGSLALLGPAGSDYFSFGVLGLSEDAEHMVFETESHLLPADAARTAGSQLYEYVGATLRVVPVDGGGDLLSTCGATAEGSSSPPNPVSRDMRRVFFMSRVGACDTARERVYLRQDEAAIAEISISRCTRPDCNAPADVRFMGATPDGSTAFLATSQQLTDDDVDESWDLYRYGVAGGTLSRVSVGAVGGGADVVPTRAYPSDGGGRVYFLARGTLAAGEGTAGEPNLYVADGAGVRFVATLAAGDDWVSGQSALAALREIKVTPGGRRIMFVTTAALTSDDVDLVRDVYLYDAEEDMLVRVSGAPGSGNGDFRVDASYEAPQAKAPRSLSDDGRHVFFTTAESLLPEDVNDVVDLYEWFDGSLGLVSSGTGDYGVIYLGASADGSTVFFSTYEDLLPGEDDDDPDVYAARLGGGFTRPGEPSPECAGEACLPQPLGRLRRADPGSLTHVEGRRAVGLRVRRPGGAALRRMAASGRLKLVVEAPRAGRVEAVASARLGHRVRVVSRGNARAVRRGKVVLRLALSPPARRRLADGGALDVRVVLHHSRLSRASAIRFTLRGGK